MDLTDPQKPGDDVLVTFPIREVAVPIIVQLGDSDVAKEPPKHNKPWTSGDVRQLKELARQNTPTRVIGLKTGRTPEAVQAAAQREGVSLKPTNQSPYNRRKK